MIIAPLFGSILILLFPISNNSSKIIALNSSLFSFVLSVLLFMNFNKTDPQFQFIGSHIWGTGFQRHEILLGVDGISLFFIILTTLIFPICFLASWNIKNFIKEYFIAFLVMESLLLLIFALLNYNNVILKLIIIYYYIIIIAIVFFKLRKKYLTKDFFIHYIKYHLSDLTKNTDQYQCSIKMIDGDVKVIEFDFTDKNETILLGKENFHLL